MKKSFNKTLVLNKKTVAHLNEREMNSIKGGYETEIEEYCESIICSVVASFCPDCLTRVRTICD